MALPIGSRLGPYEIVAPLGAGGMGEVYRARDAKLGRDVALKVLAPSFTSDPERIARFQREAQILAALNHPHIAHIHGLDDSNGTLALVMELVEGETLDARLKAAPNGLPLDEALGIAHQIADALAAAHDKGIIHRDLKPANVALTADGHVKVLDFGLAKLEPSGGDSSAPGGLTHSPTLTFAATQAGMILGTAAYMAPEQARGRAADKRCDIWAFGCVLYEMLTGRKAFDGEDATDIIAAVVRADPQWDALPASVPDHIRTLVKRCLVKDRKQRIADIAVALYIINEPPAAPAVPTPPLAPAAATSRPRLIAAAGGGVIAGALLAGAGWMATQPAAPPAPQVSRFAIVPPPAHPLSFHGADRDIAISPDGMHIAYRAGLGQSGLFLRRIDQLDAQRVAGVEGVRTPFFSPDSRWIGFWQSGEMRKISITGGPPITLCRVIGPPRGAVWADDNTIVFASNDLTTGLMRVSAAGGEPAVLTTTDPSRRDGDHFFPSTLPGDRGVLFTIVSPGLSDSGRIAILDPKTGQVRIVMTGGTSAQYVEAARQGFLVYAAAGTLRAVRFDLASLGVVGDPFPVSDRIQVSNTGAANYAVSTQGTLVYAPSVSATMASRRSLVWVSREGREQPIDAPQRAYAAVRISPDGTRAAAEIRDQENDIWVLDLRAAGPLTRLTLTSGLEQFPTWTPDGKYVVFTGTRDGAPNLYRRAADGTGDDERLTTNPNPQFPTSVSPDGATVVGFELNGSSPDLAAFPAGPQRDGPGPSRTVESRVLVKTPFIEANPEISPDGRHLAYQSTESGQPEIYVRPFPNVAAGRWQVSTGGGTRPVWARNGRELFYLDGENLLTAIPVQTSTAGFSAGSPARILTTRYAVPLPARSYDASSDGRRFLMIKEPSVADDSITPASLVVIEHWFEELQQKVQAK